MQEPRPLRSRSRQPGAPSSPGPQKEVHAVGANPSPGTPTHTRGHQGGWVQVGERPRVSIPGRGDSREGSKTRGEKTSLTQKEAAMVETIWGAASFSSSSSVVNACVPKVSVSPCSAKLLHIVCCRVVRERPDHKSRAGVPEDVVEACSKTVRKHSIR